MSWFSRAIRSTIGQVLGGPGGRILGRAGRQLFGSPSGGDPQNIDLNMFLKKDPQLKGLLDKMASSAGMSIPELFTQLQDMEAQGVDIDKAIDEYVQSVPELLKPVQEAEQAQVGRGEELGRFDQRRFEERFQPALARLQNVYGDYQKQVGEGMEARGIGHRGSFAEDGKNVGFSEPEAYQQALLGREFAQEAGNITKEAQAQAERQQLAEYQARGAEPEMALARARLGLGASEAIPGMRTGAYQARTAEPEMALRRYGALAQPFLEQRGVPAESIYQTERGGQLGREAQRRAGRYQMVSGALGAAAAAASTFCCAKGSLIDTPNGPVKIEDVQIGDFVFSVHGQPVQVTNTGSAEVPDDYKVLYIALADGRFMLISETHPILGLRLAGALRPGDAYDSSTIELVSPVEYHEKKTYDIKTLSHGGGYLVNGIPVLSTLVS